MKWFSNRVELSLPVPFYGGDFGVIHTLSFGVGVSCRILYSFVTYLYISCSRSITSVGEGRANLSAYVYLLLCGFCLERFALPLGV